MNKLSVLLRERREELGLTYEDLHARTKIRLQYLQAIEAGEYDVIPGEVYLRGFIRSIASELGIDQQEAMRIYQQDTEPISEISPPDAAKDAAPAAPPVISQPTKPVTKARSADRSRVARQKSAPRPTFLIWLLVIAVVIIVGVVLWDKVWPKAVVDVPGDILAPTDDPVDEPEPPVEPVIKIELQNPEQANPLYFVHPGPLQVVLTVESGECWVGAKTDNKANQVMLNAQREATLTLDAENQIEARLGNPNALRLVINGQNMGIIGGTSPIDLTVRLQATP